MSTPAQTFWRRRLTALAVVLLIVVLLARACGGDEDARPAALPGLPDEPVRFTVAASGDLLIHGPVAQRALADGGGRRYDFRPMLRSVRPVIAGSELAICHLEQPLTAGQPSGYPVFRAPRELADAIRWAGWDACSTATNHALDGGQEAIDFTLRTLDRLRLGHSGTGSGPGARSAALMRAKGTTVALLAYTERIRGMPPAPRPWSVRFAEPRRILGDARAARRAGAGAVIVSLHWGEEYRHEPTASQRRLALALTRSPDVTAVIGQHVHVVQPIEFVNGKPVVFGEGNLLSNQTAACCPAAAQDGLIALLEVVAGPEAARVRRVRYVPTFVQHPEFRVIRAPAESWRRTVGVVGRARAIEPVPARAP